MDACYHSNRWMAWMAPSSTFIRSKTVMAQIKKQFSHLCTAELMELLSSRLSTGTELSVFTLSWKSSNMGDYNTVHPTGLLQRTHFFQVKISKMHGDSL